MWPQSLVCGFKDGMAQIAGYNEEAHLNNIYVAIETHLYSSEHLTGRRGRGAIFSQTLLKSLGKFCFDHQLR